MNDRTLCFWSPPKTRDQECDCRGCAAEARIAALETENARLKAEVSKLQAVSNALQTANIRWQFKHSDPPHLADCEELSRDNARLRADIFLLGRENARLRAELDGGIKASTLRRLKAWADSDPCNDLVLLGWIDGTDKCYVQLSCRSCSVSEVRAEPDAALNAALDRAWAPPANDSEPPKSSTGAAQ